MTNYDPAAVAVQLNLIGSHDAPPALTGLGPDRAVLRRAMRLQLTLPGPPCIYYGVEIGMEGGHDPDCRRSFPAGAGAGDQELRAFVRAAAAARHGHVALRRGPPRVVGAGRPGGALAREGGGARAVVA